MRRLVLPLLAGLAAAPALAQPSPLPEQPTWAREIAATGLDSAFALALDGQGRILVAGSAAYNVVFARLHADGRIDSTFGTNGIVQLQPDPANRSVLRTLAVDVDGRIVAAGTTGAAGRGDVLVVRLLSDGRRDASFGTNGIVRRDVSGDDRVRALLPVADGYLVGGSAEGLATGGGTPVAGRGAFLAKVTLLGTDASWGASGVIYPDFRGASEITTLRQPFDGGNTVVGGVRSLSGQVDAVFFPIDQNGDEVTFPLGSGRKFFALTAEAEGPIGLTHEIGTYGAVARSGADVLVMTFSGWGTWTNTGTFDAGGVDVPKGYYATGTGYTLVAGTSDGQLGFLLSNDVHTESGGDATGVTVPYQTTARRYAVGGRPTGFEAMVMGSGRRAYVTGWTAGTAGRTSLLVAAFDLPAIVAGEEVTAPNAFTLNVSPLPARGMVTMRLPTAARLALVDALGRTVRTLDVAAGTHPLDVSGLSAGVYILRADAEGQVATQLLPVVR